MDQLKTQLAALKQHSFWVMCVGILIVSVVSWYMSVSSLDQQKDQRLTEIKGKFTALGGLKTSNPLHPNETTNKGMDELNLRLAQQIADGWRKQYELQEKVLVWPDFGQEFQDAVTPLRPIESIPLNYGADKDINVGLRDIYRNFIIDQFPELAKIIGANWSAQVEPMDGGAGAFDGGTIPGAEVPPGTVLGPDGMPLLGPDGLPLNDKYVVQWSVENQQELLAGHFGFTARAERPTTLEVLYAQEDLWVLTALMNVIARTNTGAEAAHEAAIKRIDFVRIGRTAMGLAGQVKPIGTPKAGMLDPNSAGAMPVDGADPAAAIPADGSTGSLDAAPSPDGGGMPLPGGEGVGYGATGAVASNDPAEGRYVDNKYLPLSAARLRSALTSTDPQDAILAVAKRVPVRMRFQMNQQKLNALLAECGNSKLPVEVRQVRIGREPAAAGMGGGGSYGGGYSGGYSGGAMMPGADGGYGGEGRAQTIMPGGGSADGGYGGISGSAEGGYGGVGGTAGRSAREGSTTADATVEHNLIEVEIYGIVYIYNPVNKSQLGITEAVPDTASAPTTTTTTTSGG